MGRLIDVDKFEAFVIRTNGDEEFVNGVQYVLEKINNAPTVEAIPKDQYEARLKADMVDMLTDIRDEIASNYLIEADTGIIISGILTNFKTQKLLDRINNEIDKLKDVH